MSIFSNALETSRMRLNLNDVIGVPGLLESLADDAKTLRRLALVNRSCRDALNQESIWRQALAHRAMVLPTANLSIPSTKPLEGAYPRFRAIYRGLAIFEANAEYKGLTKKQCLSKPDQKALSDTEKYLKENIWELCEVATNLQNSISGARVNYNKQKNERLSVWRKCWLAGLAGTCITTCLNLVAGAIFLTCMSAIMFSDGDEFAEPHFGFTLVMWANQVSSYGETAAFALIDAYCSEAAEDTAYQRTLRELTWRSFLTQHRRNLSSSAA